MVSPFRNTLWISPASDFAFVRQTLRVSVSTPVSVPMKVFPCVVKTLTCFWRRFESSSMNFRPAVEDSFPVPSERADPETAISPLVQRRFVSGSLDLPPQPPPPPHASPTHIQLDP